MRHTGADVDLRRPRRIMIALRNREMKLVMMKLSKVCKSVSMSIAIHWRWRTPAPATPASVCTDSGISEQFVGTSNIVVESGVVQTHAKTRPQLECS